MGRHKENWAGYRRMIIELCMEYGFVPRMFLSQLVAPSQKVMLRRLGEMINEGVITKYSYNKQTVVGLNKKNINQIAEYYGYDIKEHYISHTEALYDTFRWRKSDHQGNLRLYESGIIGCMMYGICESITGDKKDIEKAIVPTYYSSMEYKRMLSDNNGIQTLQSTGSRNYGVLKKSDGLYFIYYIKQKYKMDYITESKTILSLNKYGTLHNAGGYKGSVMFVKGYDVMGNLLRDLSHPNLAIIRNVLKSCRVYELTKEGKDQLKVFIDGHDIKRSLLSPDQISGAKDLTCDGYDENGYYLVLCDPDIAKLMDFMDLSQVKDDNFTLFIYKNQLPMVEHLKHRMKIKVVNFTKLCETFSRNNNNK